MCYKLRLPDSLQIYLMNCPEADCEWGHLSSLAGKRNLTQDPLKGQGKREKE